MNGQPVSNCSEIFLCDDYPMYVQRWDPTSDKAPVSAATSVVLVHGGVHTGVCWTSRPDGSPGWAQALAKRGSTVFVVDWPGVGRSAGQQPHLHSTAGHIVTALTTLVREVTPALLIGHSIGAAIAAKVAADAPEHVTGLISIAPAPHGNIASDRPPSPTDEPIIFDDAAMHRFFCNAPRFPHDAIDRYRRSLCTMSPGVFNALSAVNGSHDLVIDDLDALAVVPRIVIAGDHDQLVSSEMSTAVAASLSAPHITVGSDWGLAGFGHMIPIETGSEEILDRCLRWLADATR